MIFNDLVVKSAMPDRPDPGIMGRLYSDGLILYRDSGTAWEVYLDPSNSAVEAPVVVVNAADVVYVPTAPLTATNVQDAIDELVGMIPAAGLVDPMTTIGDIIIRNAANTTTRLGVGSNGQVLTLVTGVPAWATPAAGFSDPMTTAGDIIIRNGSNVTSRLGVSTNGFVLTLVTGVPAWAASTGGFADPMTSIGDIIIRNGSNVTARLAAGTNGHVLTLTAGVPAWAAAAGGSGTPGGSTTQIQFNDASAFAGDAGFTFTKVASSVNGINFSPATTGNNPTISAIGSNADVGLNFNTKGTGDVFFTSPAAQSMEVKIATTSSGVNTILQFNEVSTAKNLLGTAGASGQLVGDSAAGDFVIRSQGGGIRFTTDSGIVTGLRIEASTGKSITKTSATGSAGLSLPHGTAPTSPVNGDFWSTTAGFFGQVNGSTVGPFGAGGGGSGTVNTGAINCLAYYPAAGTTVDDAAALVYDSTAGNLTINAVASATFTVNAATGGNSLMRFSVNSTPLTYIGIANASAVITGAVPFNLCIRSETQDILISPDAGSTYIRINTSRVISDSSGTVNFTPSIRVSGSNASLIFDSTSGTTGNQFINRLAGAAYAYWGVVSSSNGFVTGSVAGDTVFRAENRSILYCVDAGTTVALKLTATTGEAIFVSSVKTGAPSGGTAGAWKMGILVTASVTPDTSRYIQLDVGGTLYKLIVST